MKPKLAIISVIIILIAMPLSGQLNILQDTLIIKTRENKYSDKPVQIYLDRTTSYDSLPKPKGANGKIPGVYSYELNSHQRLNQIANQIFTYEEIIQLIDNRCTLDIIALSSGNVVSASILFFNGKPEIYLNKLVEFSKQIKQQLTLDIDFDKEIVAEGYTQYYFYVYDILQMEEKDRH